MTGSLITRRRFLIAMGATAAALGSNAFLIEPRRIVVTRHRIASSHATNADPHIRVVQITDLHLRRVSRHVRRIAQVINELRADVVVFTGDMIDDRDRIPELKAFLSLIDQRPIKYATLGNWEHWARVDLKDLGAAYESSSCRLLVNETAIVKHRDRDVLITGVDDWTGGTPDIVAALADVAPRTNHIVLAHSPVFRDFMYAATSPANENETDLASYSINCVLSGHTHGGQMALFGWAPVRPAGSGDYVSGWYRETSPALYISRGLGTSVLPVRFGSTPEVACFDWRLSS